MDTPIISPLIIYFMGIVDVCKAVFIAGGGLWIFICELWALSLISNEYGDPTPLATQKSKLFALKGLIGIWFVVIGFFIPTEATIIKMIVARNITPANITTVVKAGKQLKDEVKKDVLDIILAIKKPEHGGK